jgi:hypothetical protein
MHPILKHLIDTNFSDLTGSRLEGQIALTDDIINLGIHELLNQLTQPSVPENHAPAAPPTSSTRGATKAAMPDPKLLLQKVKVDHLKYRTEQGKTVLEIKAGL